MWKYYAILAAVFAAATAILAKVGVKGVDSHLAVAVRTVIVLGMTWGMVFLTGGIGQLKALTRFNWLFLILSGIATGLSWLCYFKALQTGEVSKVASIDKLSVALTILLGILLLHEPADPKVIAGGALIVIGSVIIIW